MDGMERGAALAALEQEARAALAYADYPAQGWTLPRGAPDGSVAEDVLVVGAGINGLAIAFALARERVARVRVIDAAGQDREGPWTAFARMRWLRTPKTLPGPDLGFASLSFPAWYRARFGEAAWESLDKAPNGVWVAYLAWFRRAAGIAVRNDTALVRITQPGEGLLACLLRDARGERIVHARRVVLATGVLGAGGPAVPDIIASLPRACWAHSSDPIGFDRLAGARVAVIGAGASAFDNAGCALEAGAAEVTLIARRRTIDQPNLKQGVEAAGFLRHWGDLPDALRFRLHRMLATASVPPPPDSVARCTAHGARFRVLTDARLLDASCSGAVVSLMTRHGVWTGSFVIAATGFATDMRARPELGDLGTRVALWRDRFPPAAEDPTLADMPYLDGAFAYTARDPADAPILSRIHDVGIAAVPSLGPVCVGLNGIKFGPDRLARGISRVLFLDDAEAHVAAAEAFARRAMPAGNDPTVI
jgi:cation diffusion facilitator CzcD-associated flavoprotein CzcO